MTGQPNRPETGRLTWQLARPRGRRCRWAAAVVLGLAGLGVVADRGASAAAGWLAERELERRGAARPDVTVAGFPFLTQVARRELGEVTVTGDAVPVQGLLLRAVEARLMGVDIDAPRQPVAQRLQARALAPFALVEAEAGLPAGSLSFRGGRLRVEREVMLLGRTLHAAGTAEVRIDGSDLVITPTRVEVSAAELAGGLRLAGDLSGWLRQALSARVGVRKLLPPDLRLDDMQVVAGGFAISISGTDVPLDMGGAAPRPSQG